MKLKKMFSCLSLVLVLTLFAAVPTLAAEPSSCTHQWENTGDCTATCTQAGVQPQTCSVCGSTRNKPVSATGHSWENTGICTATCTQAGVQPQICSVCSSIRNKPVSATGHSWENSGASTATCTKDGVQPQICSDCTSTRNKPVSATGHTEEVIPSKAATCTETGLTEGKKCSVCGEILDAQEEIPATGHNEEVVAGTAATCTEKGKTDGVRCTVCGETLLAQDEIPALGHTEEVILAVKPTCTKTGLTEGAKCSVCNTVLTEQTEIPATGHTEKIVPGTAATCTESGLTEGKVCSVCDTVLVEQKEIPALGLGRLVEITPVGEVNDEGNRITVSGSTLEWFAKDASVGRYQDGWWVGVKIVSPDNYTKGASYNNGGKNEDGSLEWTNFDTAKDGDNWMGCWLPVTPEYLENANANNNILTWTYKFDWNGDEVIDQTFKMIVSSKNITLNKDGKINTQTDENGEFIWKDGVHKMHNEEVVPGKDATCTEPGLTDGVKCTVCGETLLAQKEIAAQGHTEEAISGKAATCTETGLTEGKKCTVCGEITVAQKEIPAQGHTEETVVGKAATCTEPGLKDGKKCTVCGEITVAQEEIPVTDHTEEAIPGKAATCTETGLTEGKKCTVCGEILTAQKEIPANGHNWDEGEVTTPATCTEAGVKTYSCTVEGCDGTKTEEIDATGHTVEVIPGKAATCTEKGMTEGRKCSVCGTVITESAEIPATGHTEVVVPGKAATCTEKGLTDGKKCSICDEILDAQEDIPALGHTFNGGTCDVCGASAPAYAVVAPTDVDNGSVTVSPESTFEGGTVTITVKPDEGYQPDTLTVTDQDGKEIELTDKGDGKYTFNMPASGVTVKATFTQIPTTDPDPVKDPVKDCPQGDTCPAVAFDDIDAGAWYHDGVHYCVAEELMNGVGNNMFAPNENLSRAMLVTVLYRMEGEPAVADSTFTDVPAGEWYSKAVAWAAENKIVAGYGDGTFGPNDEITREQMAAIMYLYAEYKNDDVSGRADLSGYTDADEISEYAVDAMKWANEEKLILGVTDTTLVPGGNATRAQVATVLMRFCEDIAK